MWTSIKWPPNPQTMFPPIQIIRSSLTVWKLESLFATSYEFYSSAAFVIWAKQELQAFVSIFRRQVFESKASLTTIADSVLLSKNHCMEVCAIFIFFAFPIYVSFCYQGCQRSGIFDNSTGGVPMYRISGCHEKVDWGDNRLNARYRREQINRFMISDIKVQ